MFGSILAGFLGLLWLLDALRLRGRARSLHVLSPSDAAVSDTHAFLSPPGSVPDDATKRAASAYALAQGLEVLDVVPASLSSSRATTLMAGIDPKTYRGDRLAQGITSGTLLLVDAALLARVKGSPEYPGDPSDAVSFFELARVLKRHASTTTDVAVSRTLAPSPVSLRQRRRLLLMQFSGFAPVAVAFQFGLLALAFATAPIPALVALAIYHVQVFLVTSGTPLVPSDRFLFALVRPFADVVALFGPAAPAREETAAADSRGTYTKMLERGTTPFFEPVRSDCPVCAGTHLSKAFELGDRYQFKPGRFTVTRCDDCHHLFQNPRLSIEGLSFYYRDFYDGLGKERLETLFAAGPGAYLARARMVADVEKPQRWLDVGAGHGHFCNVAKGILPETSFDGLDMTDSIDDAERRRWVRRGIRGLFPEVAPRIEASGELYDVVSMSHYLEHTIDQRAEIAAAAKVLRDDGLLLIELPDPECGFGRLFGRHWMPWFQPQHLNFLSLRNLERLLAERGFSTVARHRGEAHIAVEFTILTFTIIENLAPPADLPWRKPGGVLARAWRALVWCVFFPVLVLARILDLLIDPLARRPGWSNAYRVLARKSGGVA